MATAYVTFGSVGARSATGGTFDIFHGPVRTQTITSGAASAAGSFAATPGEVALVWCDVPLFVTSGANPVAAMANSQFVPASTFGIVSLNAGDKIAVINA